MIERQSPQILAKLWWCWCTYDHFISIRRFVLALFIFLLTYFSKDGVVTLLKVILGESFMVKRLYWMSYFLNMHCLSGREKTDTFSYRNYSFWTLGLISEPFLLRATPKLSSILGQWKNITKKKVGEGGVYLAYTFFFIRENKFISLNN